jgi:hypothetical protein
VSAVAITVCDPGLLQNTFAALNVLPAFVVVAENASATPVPVAAEMAGPTSTGARVRRETRTGSDSQPAPG